MTHKRPTDKSTQGTRKAGVQPGDYLEVTIDYLDEDGCGTGRHDGTPVVVHGAFPGEDVRVKVELVARRGIIGKLQKVLRHSPDRRRDTVCQASGSCDGCPLIRLDYAAQLSWKRDLVADQIGRYSSLKEVPVSPVMASPRPLNYRNSAKLVVAGRFADPLIGIYRRGTHEVLDIAECPLHHPLINRIIAAVKDGIRKGKVPVFNQRSGLGLLRYLVVRVAEAENQAMVVFVTARRSYNEVHHLASFVRKQVPEVSVVAQNVNPSEGNVILGAHDLFLTKAKALQTSLGDHRFLVSPRSFFQVNSGSARLIYEYVRKAAQLTGRETVLDLYCGIGGIALFLAGKAREIIGVEVVEAAVEDATRNCRLNGIRNCTFAAGDVVEILALLVEEKRRIDLVVLNPPRKGCDSIVLTRVASLLPKKIFYVSCSPASLARDLDTLATLGYQTLSVQPVDMFPQTPHVESVASLVRIAS
ncbi:MAG TPA: 23S rRNA (uracil(1939)-C(5))-methyltransferase RlmD [Geobacteraceae bacterium]